MQKNELDIDKIHIAKFGRRRTQAENLKKIGEEYGELIEAVMDNNIEEIKKECADIIISTITVLQTYYGRDLIFIEKIISDKIDELFKRNKIKR